MATMQRATSACTGTARTNLVAARPIAHRHCFKAAISQSAQRSVVGRGRASLQVVAVAAVEASAEAAKMPVGYHQYETMMVLKPSLSDEERDRELAKFEAYLNKQECFDIHAVVKGRSKLAYPIKKEYEGIYVLYQYCAHRQTARSVQLLLSKPEAGAEDTLLRHITVCLQ
ncbi:30S ribosomal protein S6 [Tetrabaena socialis]|uniref:30S ribosomal protein S6 n=1 Tax=Tetrabaena socialis TaxID=47790 RepID=A0A2J8AGR6_9CHLO|nr:30S ribosomal protein S6 [Tetrabaena socialis]|eukprot:PNH11702.1 30S ribosomal protein S6 [Tetrabaena socialis]